jgi:hypothetical protein
MEKRRRDLKRIKETRRTRTRKKADAWGRRMEVVRWREG